MDEQNNEQNNEGQAEVKEVNFDFGAAKEDYLGRIQDESERTNFEKTLGDLKTLDGLMSGFVHAQKELGRRSNTIALPDPNAPEEDWSKIYNKLGRPEDPDGYELAVEGYELDENVSKEIKESLHENGLSKKQAKAVFDKFIGLSKGEIERLNQTEAQKIEEVKKYKETKYLDKLEEVENITSTFLNENLAQESREEVMKLATKHKSIVDLLNLAATSSVPKDGASVKSTSAFQSMTPESRIEALWQDKEFTAKYFKNDAKAVEQMRTLQALRAEQAKK